MNVGDVINKILMGGFLGGYRTMIIAAVLIVNELSKYVLGDIGLVSFLQNDWDSILMALGLVTARLGVAK